MSGTKEFDGTIDVPGASLRPQAPQIWRWRAPIMVREGELKGGRRKRRMHGCGVKMVYGAQGGKGKGAGCHRGLLGTGRQRLRGAGKPVLAGRGRGSGPPGAQDTISALRLNNQPVPSNSAEPVAYRGGKKRS